MICSVKVTHSCLSKIVQKNPLVKKIFAAIKQQGGRVLIVGGFVRDCLLGLESFDFDFEVYHLQLDQLQQTLQSFGAVSFVGKSFGVLRLHGFDADWSLPRRDSSGRKPQVEFDPDMSFYDAFIRRDLTVNAMGIDVETGELIDPFDGCRDLEHKVLSSPDLEFFVKDPLRLFRVMQFVGRFEMFVDQQLSDVCKSMDISEVSVERIEAEFVKLFTLSAKPSLGLQWLKSIGRLQEILSELKLSQEVFSAVDCVAQQTLDDDDTVAAMWAVIVQRLLEQHDIDVQYQATSDDLSKIKIAVKRFMRSHDRLYKVALIAWYVRYVSEIAHQNNTCCYKWIAHWLAPHISLQLLAQVASCLYEQKVIDLFVQQASAAGVLQSSEEPLIQGRDLLYVVQGPELGKLIKKAYQVQIDQNIQGKKELMNIVLKL